MERDFPSHPDLPETAVEAVAGNVVLATQSAHKKLLAVVVNSIAAHWLYVYIQSADTWIRSPKHRLLKAVPTSLKWEETDNPDYPPRALLVIGTNEIRIDIQDLLG